MRSFISKEYYHIEQYNGEIWETIRLLVPDTSVEAFDLLDKLRKENPSRKFRLLKTQTWIIDS